jgi:hypothetical protein
MSNTATAAMVCPIAMAVLEELFPKLDETPQGFRKRRASIFKERSEVDFEAFVAKVKAKRARIHHQQSLPEEPFNPEPKPIKKVMKKQLSFKIDPEPVDPSELTRFIRSRDRQMDNEFELNMQEQNEDEEHNDDNEHADDTAKKAKMKKMLLFSILLSSNIGGNIKINLMLINLVN